MPFINKLLIIAEPILGHEERREMIGTKKYSFSFDQIDAGRTAFSIQVNVPHFALLVCVILSYGCIMVTGRA